MYLLKLKAVAGRLTSFQALDTHQYGPDDVSAEFHGVVPPFSWSVGLSSDGGAQICCKLLDTA